MGNSGDGDGDDNRQNASSIPPALYSRAEKKKSLLFKQGVKLVSSAEEEKAKKRKRRENRKPRTYHTRK